MSCRKYFQTIVTPAGSWSNVWTNSSLRVIFAWFLNCWRKPIWVKLLFVHRMNLRDLLQKYGKDVGLNIMAVQIYARHLFAALAILRKSKVIHADIKPDNILVPNALNLSKLCDFGAALEAPYTEPVPYLASRFYRAPEISIAAIKYTNDLSPWASNNM